MALSALVPLLIQSGPTLIRSIGGLFGSEGKAASEQAAKWVESVTDTEVGPVLSAAQAASMLEKKLYQLPASMQETLLTMKTELEKVHNEREQNQQLFELGLHKETQATIRHGDTGGNRYVKETRPKMARLSTYAAIAYSFLFQGLAVAGHGSGIDWGILTAIYSPALAYMGMRTADAFSRYKNTNSR
ncbi:hypothetical protein [Candidatus Sororendozoicomonas aggregata]|uniref:hypothetical protein n=1 Tax=Candidatus Sororendozoicomonas aggregata TaxID=3073239 RepID=UPI002ED152D5